MPDAHADQDWRAWFAEHGARLRLIARQWTRSEADADDVVQEALFAFGNTNVTCPAIRTPSW